MNEKIEEFNLRIMDIVNMHVPLKKRLFKNLLAPWLTDDIRNVMRNRDLARRAWRRRRSSDLYDEYRALRNRAQMLVRSAKRHYFMDMFNRVVRTDEVWRGLKHLGLIKSKVGGGSPSSHCSGTK